MYLYLLEDHDYHELRSRRVLSAVMGNVTSKVYFSPRSDTGALMACHYQTWPCQLPMENRLHPSRYQFQVPEMPSKTTKYRCQHVKDGLQVSCAQLGVSGQATPSPLAQPQELHHLYGACSGVLQLGLFMTRGLGSERFQAVELLKSLVSAQLHKTQVFKPDIKLDCTASADLKVRRNHSRHETCQLTTRHSTLTAT